MYWYPIYLVISPWLSRNVLISPSLFPSFLIIVIIIVLIIPIRSSPIDQLLLMSPLWLDLIPLISDEFRIISHHIPTWFCQKVLYLHYYY